MTPRADHRIRLTAALTCLVVIAGCDMLNPDRQLITRVGSTAYLAENSPEIELLLSGQKARDAEMEQFWREKHDWKEMAERFHVMETDPDHYSPWRREFLLAMSRQSAVVVPGDSYLRLLKSSGVRCNLNARYALMFIKVRITSGPMLGHEGWMCESDIGRTVVWP